jgi:hypothetical protein
MVIDYTSIWLVLEWIIFVLMVGPVCIFFFLKYRRDKAVEDKEGMAFNLRYLLFFILTAINQLIYIIDMVEVYREAIIGWKDVFDVEFEFLILGYIMSSQVLIMATLFLSSFTLIFYPVEKYLKWKSYPITKFLLISSIIIGALWLIFGLFKVPQPRDLYLFQIVLSVSFFFALFGLGICFFGFFILYFKFAISYGGIVRKKALIISIGVLLLVISVIGGNLTRPLVEGTSSELIGPLTLLPGILVLIYGFNIRGF